MLRVSGGRRPADDPGQRLASRRPVRPPLQHEHRRARAEVGGVPRRDGGAAVDGRQPAEDARSSCAGLRHLVVVEGRRRARRRRSFETGAISSSKKPPREGGGVALLAAAGPLVLLLSADAVVRGLGRGLHRAGHARVRARDDELVGEDDVPEPLAEPSGLEEVRHTAQVLDAAGDREPRRRRERMLLLARLMAVSDEQQARSTVYDDPVVGDAGAQLHLAGDRSGRHRES